MKDRERTVRRRLRLRGGGLIGVETCAIEDFESVGGRVSRGGGVGEVPLWDREVGIPG